MTGSALSTWGRAALAYAERIGWAVHLLKPGAKEPISLHGFKDATTDLDQIRAWWTDHPSANIGIATGKVSGLSVLDVDVKDGACGDVTLAALMAKHGASLDGHVCQRTWSGGLQYVFAYDPRARQGISCYGPGLDGRNDGGYIVAPPSLVNWRAYKWIVQPGQPGTLRPMPEWLVKSGELWGPLRGKSKAGLPLPGGELATEPIVAGHRRDHLWRLGRSMRAFGAGALAIEAAMRAENEARCTPALEEDEVAKTIKDAVERPWPRREGGSPAFDSGRGAPPTTPTDMTGWRLGPL